MRDEKLNAKLNKVQFSFLIFETIKEKLQHLTALHLAYKEHYCMQYNSGNFITAI